MKYKLFKEIRKDDEKRLSFNKLAINIFGIDFEYWNKKGGWNDNYITYGYYINNRCISNASFNPMELIIDGETVKAIQIGTVMTDPEYRGQGLAKELINIIINDNKDKCELFFLYANPKAYSLYKGCGFSHRLENSYIVDVTDYKKIETPLNRSILSIEKFINIKKSSIPISEKLSAIDDIHVAYFYYYLGFDQMIYKVKPDVYVVYKIEKDVLSLYAVYSKDKQKLENIIKKITPAGINMIKLLFTPNEKIKGLIVEEDNIDCMMKNNPQSIPLGYKFPLISKT